MAENTTTDEAVILADYSINSNIACQTNFVQMKVKKERKKKGLVHGIILDHLLMKKEIRNQSVSIVVKIILLIQVKMVMWLLFRGNLSKNNVGELYIAW
ncbi:hypothetical protein P3S67_001065 [Capsicum chacoense]